MAHYQFQLSIAEDLYLEAEKEEDVDAASKKSERRHKRAAKENMKKKGTKKKPVWENYKFVKDQSKWPQSRFVGHNHPLDTTKTPGTGCQYCRWECHWEGKKKISRKTFRCGTCRVILCQKHWNLWHRVK